MEAQAPRRSRQPGGGRRPLVHLRAPAAEPMAQPTHHQCDRAVARGVQAADQNPKRAAVGRHRHDVVLGAARLGTDQHAQGGWLADALHKTHRSADFTSMSRFNLVSFPLFVVLADVGLRAKWLLVAVIGLFSASLFMNTALFARRIWIG